MTFSLSFKARVGSTVLFIEWNLIRLSDQAPQKATKTVHKTMLRVLVVGCCVSTLNLGGGGGGVVCQHLRADGMVIISILFPYFKK